ncbi:MAG: DUF839 domain-containing protein [Aquificota bacterium]|nr:DUF839 domain-containing protein [Aquificota bacterium]
MIPTTVMAVLASSLFMKMGKPLCLRLKTGKNRSSKFASDEEVIKAAAFLETRKYGAYLGGTTELNKEEGITYNPDKNVIYIAISSIEKAMEDNYKNIEPANHVRLPKNKCGGIYEMVLDENYNGTKLRAILVGKPLEQADPDYSKYADEYYCHPDYIANPDNIMYIGRDILLIGEDSSKHITNMVWAYNVNTGTLTRIATVPTGGEVTGNFTRGLIGRNYTLWLNVQHPLRDKFVNAKGEIVNLELINSATEAEKRGIVGYIEGIPQGLFPY